MTKTSSEDLKGFNIMTSYDKSKPQNTVLDDSWAPPSVVDDRQSDTNANIFSGFSSAHYAAYTDCKVAFDRILTDSAALGKRTESDVIVVAIGINNACRFTLKKGASYVDVALLRGSTEILAVVQEVPQKCAQYACLASNTQFFSREEVLKQIDAETLHNICYYGQKDAFQVMYSACQSNSNVKSVIQGVLENYKNPQSLLDDCDAKIVYEQYNTTLQIKSLLKKRLIKMLGEFGVSYENIDTQPLSNAQLYQNMQLDKWFSCVDQSIALNMCNEFQNAFDYKATNITQSIFFGFTLSQYCIIRDNDAVLAAVHEREWHVLTSQEYNVKINNFDVTIPIKSNLLMMAIRCNALKCTQLLLRLLKYPDNEIPRDDTQFTPAMIAASLLNYKAAEEVLTFPLLQEKEFVRVKEGAEVYQKAIMSSNIFLLALYNKLIKFQYFEEPLFRFAILYNNIATDNENGVTHEAQRLAGLIYRKAVDYFRTNCKWDDPEWNDVMAQLDQEQVKSWKDSQITNNAAKQVTLVFHENEPKERKLTVLQEKERARCKTYGVSWKDPRGPDDCPYKFGQPTKEYRPKTPEPAENRAGTAFVVEKKVEKPVFELQAKPRETLDPNAKLVKRQTQIVNLVQQEELDRQQAEEERIAHQKKESDERKRKEMLGIKPEVYQEPKVPLFKYDFDNKDDPEKNSIFNQNTDIQTLNEERDISDEEKKRRNDLKVMLINNNYIFQNSNIYQLQTMAEECQEDRIIPIDKTLQHWFDVVKRGDLNLCKAMVRSYIHQYDTRENNQTQMIYNGFSAIHYAILFDQLPIMKYLMEYEFLNTTRSRVILKCPGIGDDRSIVLPIGTNCLQLALYLNRTDIIKFVFDHFDKKSVALENDPIQQAFGKQKPLSHDQQKSIMKMKDEFEQNAVITFGMCRRLLDDNDDEMVNCFKFLCYEMITPDILNYNNDVFLQRAYLSGNANAVNIWRSEVLANPVDLIPMHIYPRMLHQIFLTIRTFGGQGKLKELIKELPINDVLKEQLDIVEKLIWAQYLKYEKDKLFESQFKQYEDEMKDVTKSICSDIIHLFQPTYIAENSCLQKIQGDKYKNILKQNYYVSHVIVEPEDLKYVNSRNNANVKQNVKSQIKKLKQEYKKIKPEADEKDVENTPIYKYYVEEDGKDYFADHDSPDLSYLNCIVQKQELSFYFDRLIAGDLGYVQKHSRDFLGQVDKRFQVPGSKIINGFNSILYAAFYGHVDIFRMLFEVSYHDYIKPQEGTISPVSECYEYQLHQQQYFEALINQLKDQENSDQLLLRNLELAAQNILHLTKNDDLPFLESLKTKRQIYIKAHWHFIFQRNVTVLQAAILCLNKASSLEITKIILQKVDEHFTREEALKYDYDVTKTLPTLTGYNKHLNFKEQMFKNRKFVPDNLLLLMRNQAYHLQVCDQFQRFELAFTLEQLLFTLSNISINPTQTDEDLIQAEHPTLLQMVCDWCDETSIQYLYKCIMKDQTKQHNIPQPDLKSQALQLLKIPTLRDIHDTDLLLSLQFTALVRRFSLDEDIFGFDSQNVTKFQSANSALDSVKLSYDEGCVRFIEDLQNNGIINALIIYKNREALLNKEEPYPLLVESVVNLVHMYFMEKNDQGEFKANQAKIDKFIEEYDYILGKLVVSKEFTDTIREEELALRFVEDHQINRIKFSPILKEDAQDKWFKLCATGTLSSIVELAKTFAGRRDTRLNNFDQHIHQTFTGFMYACVYNPNDDVFEFLMKHEGMLRLQQDALVRAPVFDNKAYFVQGEYMFKDQDDKQKKMPGAWPLALIIVAAKQNRIDNYFHYCRERNVEPTNQPLCNTQLSIVMNAQPDVQSLMQDFSEYQQEKDVYQILITSVLFARPQFLNLIFDLGQQNQFRRNYIQQLFNHINFRGKLYQNILDVAVDLTTADYVKINYSTVLYVQNRIDYIVRHTLIQLIDEEKREGEFSVADPEIQKQIVRFFSHHQLDDDQCQGELDKEKNALSQIKEAQKYLENPEILNADGEIIDEENVKKMCDPESQEVKYDFRITYKMHDQPYISLSEQTADEDRWFDACRTNNLKLVVQLITKCRDITDKRQTDLIKQQHRGFSGLHYSAAYGASTVFNYLMNDFDDKVSVQACEVVTSAASIVNSGKYLYYLPQGSSALHIVVLTENKDLLNLCKINKSISTKLSVENVSGYSPCMVMATLSYCNESIFECNNWNCADQNLDPDQRKQKCRHQCEIMIDIIIQRCEEMKNTQFAKQIINFTTFKSCPVEFKEVCYQTVIRLINRPDEEKNEVQEILCGLKYRALEYALYYKLEDAWGKDLLLKEYCGGDQQKYSELQREYEDFRKTDVYIKDSETRMVIDEKFGLIDPALLEPSKDENGNEVSAAVLRQPPIKHLKQTNMSLDQIKYLDICRLSTQPLKEDLQFVEQSEKLFSELTDDRRSSQTVFNGFNGFLYACYFGVLDIVKATIKFQLMTQTKPITNIIQVRRRIFDPNNQDKTDYEEVPYLLTPEKKQGLLIAILRNHKEIAEFIMNYFTQLGSNQSNYSQQVLVAMQVSNYDITNDYFCKYLQNGETGYIESAYTIGNLDFPRYLENKYIVMDENASNKLASKYKFKSVYLDMLHTVDRHSYKNLMFKKSDNAKPFDELLDRILSITFQRSSDPDYQQLLHSIFGSQYEEKAKEYDNKRKQCDLLIDGEESIKQVTYNCFIINERTEQYLKQEVGEVLETDAEGQPIPEEELQKLRDERSAQAAKEMEYADSQTAQYFIAIRENNFARVKKLMGDEYRNYEKFGEFRGFYGIHMAAYFGNLEVFCLLWPKQQRYLTHNDLVVDALATGYGNRFLLSRNSNSLLVSMLADQSEIVQAIAELLSADPSLQKFYQFPNVRGVNLLYLTALCWRSNSGAYLFGCDFMQEELKHIAYKQEGDRDQAAPNPIQICTYTNCAYLAKHLYELSQYDAQFQEQFYKLCLQQNFVKLHKTHNRQLVHTEDREEEAQYLKELQELQEKREAIYQQKCQDATAKYQPVPCRSPAPEPKIFCAQVKYVSTWLDLVFELALDYALRQQTNISWQHSVEAAVRDRGLAILVQNQYLKYKRIEISEGKVILIDDYLVEQIQKDNEYVKTARQQIQKGEPAAMKDSVLLSVQLPTTNAQRVPAEVCNTNMDNLLAQTNYTVDGSSEAQKIKIVQATAVFNEHPIQRYLGDDRVVVRAARDTAVSTALEKDHYLQKLWVEISKYDQ